MGLGIVKTSWTTVILPPYSSSIILGYLIYRKTFTHSLYFYRLFFTDSFFPIYTLSITPTLLNQLHILDSVVHKCKLILIDCLVIFFIPEGMSFLIIVCIKLEYSAFIFNPEDTVLRFFPISKRTRLQYITFDFRLFSEFNTLFA